MNLNKTLYILLVVSLFSTIQTTLHSQDIKKLETLVKETMDLRRQGNYWSGLSPFRDYIVASPQEMIRLFKPYASDTLESVRSLAYDAISASGLKSPNLKIRQSAVDVLVGACMDKEAAMRKNVARKLGNFLKPDFTQQSKDKIANLLKLEYLYFQNTVKLVGFLDMTSQTPVLKGLLDTGQITNPTLEWDIQLSLARLGDKESIQLVIDKVRNAGLNDKVIYNLFPDLAYTRSREAVAYMLEVLNNDAKNCFSPNPDNPVKISCAYRVMEFLAPIIKDFPLKKDKNGELDVDDYEKALTTCREWFKIHANDYVIDRERF